MCSLNSPQMLYSREGGFQQQTIWFPLKEMNLSMLSALGWLELVQNWPIKLQKKKFITQAP